MTKNKYDISMVSQRQSVYAVFSMALNTMLCDEKLAMQTTGYIIDKRNGEKIKILIRQAKYGRHLKMRKTGKDGSHFIDEEFFLNEVEQHDRLDELKNGTSIYC